eukprot:m.440007 g.440007  ORF g.440007 m.440007 type:complete len:482 (+) comp21462_c0_seq3:338-1783(+)
MAAPSSDGPTGPLHPQRRLRHLVGIFGRNFTPIEHQGSSLPFHSYFTLSPVDGPPFYSSEVLPDTVNPTWREFDLQPKEGVNLGSSRLTVHVWGRCVDGSQILQKDDYELMLKWDVDLYGLEFLGYDLDSFAKYHHAPDSLVFHLAKCGFFHAPPCEASPSNDAERGPAYRCVDRAKVKLSYNKATLIRINTLQRTIAQTEANTQASIARSAECARARQVDIDLRSAVEKMRVVIALYKDEEKRKKKANGDERARLEALKREQQTAHAIAQESHAALAAGMQELREMTGKLNERRGLLWQVQSMVSIRQTRIILELSQIFPMQQMKNQNYTICNLELPNKSDFSGADEEAVATALGYVAHLTFMIAKYLEIPFRFPMQPMCSRSTIKDQISNTGERDRTTFPLFTKGSPRPQFDHGVFLLNKNIQQLLTHCGLAAVDPTNTIPNLYLLVMHYMSLNNQAPTRNVHPEATQLVMGCALPTLP